MLISSDGPSQSDRAAYQINHFPFIRRYAGRGQTSRILLGNPMIESMISQPFLTINLSDVCRMDKQHWPVSSHQVSLPHPDQT
jgi:hypothetical protein